MKKGEATKKAMILLLASTLILTFNIWQVRSEPETIIVPDDYATIQSAIDSAIDGDTVYVRAGTYYETVTVNKSISLIGESRETTTIASGPFPLHGYGVIITADNVVVSGFTIADALQSNIELRGNFATITNNNVSIVHAFFGIESCPEYPGSVGHIISDNIIEYSDPNIVGTSASGIHLWRTNETTVTRNRISYCGYGIYVDYSDQNTVSHNTIYSYTEPIPPGQGITLATANDNTVFGNDIFNLHTGIHLANSDNNVLGRNNVSSNCRGLYLVGDYNIVYDNIFSNNRLSSRTFSAITLQLASNNIIRGNTISLNDNGIGLYDASNDNQFFHNNFIDNTQQTRNEDSCANSWDDGYPSGGNYWSDYAGVDLDGDGLGDTPYIVDAANQDNYPLMAPRLAPSVEEPEDYVGYVDDAVQELSDDVFVRTEDVDIASLKDDFSDLFADALENIQEGDYEGAIDKLNSVKELINEEVADCAERAEIISMIDELMAHLETLS